jgi:hypothetical protein
MNHRPDPTVKSKIQNLKSTLMSFNPRIDEYIAKSADFAQPVLTHLRKLVHKACPDVVETWKWSFPNFDYKGSILCSMAAFKQHCSFGFWLGSLMEDPEGIIEKGSDKSAMGSLGKLQSIKDLPPDKVLIAYIKQAMDLIDKGVKLQKKENPTAGKPVEVPDYFTSALKKNKAAHAVFEKFPPSHKNWKYEKKF